LSNNDSGTSRKCQLELKDSGKKQYVGFCVTLKQTTDSIRKVNATYVSKAIPDKKSMHQHELPFSSSLFSMARLVRPLWNLAHDDFAPD